MIDAPKLVLVVEDDETLKWVWEMGINSEKVKLLFASTVKEAEKFLKNFKFHAIVMDAVLLDNKNGEETTFELVRRLRSPEYNYVGPIIASSCNSDYRKKLMQVGCDYETLKENFFYKLDEVIFSDHG